MTNFDLLNTLAESEGYEDVMDMLEEFSFDSVCPAICRKCHHTEMWEPDCRNGLCPECGKESIDSALILAGIL